VSRRHRDLVLGGVSMRIPITECLQSILIPGESVECTAIQRGVFALIDRRRLIAATSSRFIGLDRLVLAGFDLQSIRRTSRMLGFQWAFRRQVVSHRAPTPRPRYRTIASRVLQILTSSQIRSRSGLPNLSSSGTSLARETPSERDRGNESEIRWVPIGSGKR
jgi:hypothetical protein